MVTVEMTTDEAALVARLTGALASRTVNRALRDVRWGVALESVYSALAGGFFNRFWDDGVNDVIPHWPDFNERLRNDDER